MNADRRLKTSLIVVSAALGLGLAACQKDVGSARALGESCSANDTCEAGSVCTDGVCRQVCVTSEHCAQATDECRNGVCYAVETPACTSDADCVPVPPCAITEGARCVGGSCEYAGYLDDGTACYVGTQIGMPDGECLRGVCRDCQDGLCCLTQADCTALDEPLTCVDPAHCQGRRTTYSCDASYRCAASVTEDDSVCVGQIASDCGRYVSSQCTSDVVQLAPVCPTDCESDVTPGSPDASLCDPGTECLLGTSGYVCTIAASLGECCLDPVGCPDSVCASPDFHCGSTQATPVYRCCAPGRTCCTQASHCASDHPGYTCDFAAFACNEDCATEDDAKCLPSHHCEGTTCVADYATGVCESDADCISDNCSETLDGSAHYCVPVGECAVDASINVVTGYDQCAPDGSYLRHCGASGWEAPVASPDAADDFCLSGAGYDLKATCTSGAPGGFDDPACVDCAPYDAANVTSCYLNCSINNNAKCAPLYHCYSVDNGCYSNASSPTSYCDIDSECTSWRCDGVCMDRLANGLACDEDSDCVSTRCDSTCMDRLVNGQTCNEDSDCLSYYCDYGICADYLGSCPLVYAWDGGVYRYQTDMQGPVIGPPRFSSRIALYGSAYIVLPDLVSAAGVLKVKVRESLPEVTYLDEVKLLAVDAPVDYDVVSSSAEDTYRMGFVQPFEVHTATGARLPTSALDTDGNDMLAAVSAVDGVIAPAEGILEPVYTFDFGPIGDLADAKLLIDGWAVIGAAYASSTSLISYIEVVDTDGSWVPARTFGFPAGDLKRMSIDLAGIFLSDDHRVRLHLGRAPNSKWVIDRIMLAESPEPTVLMSSELAPTADLQLGGRASITLATYEHRILAGTDSLPLHPEATAYGAFTRYGDVTPLLADADDLFVVMRHGDALDLEFPDTLPALEAGMARTYLLKVHLFYKTFEPLPDVIGTVDPMPFEAMTDYPPPEGETYPTDAVHQDYLSNWNTRLEPVPE